MSLLKEIKKIKNSRGEKSYGPITKEFIEISVAYLKGEVMVSHISKAMKQKGHGTPAYVLIARSLKEAFRLGLIKVK